MKHESSWIGTGLFGRGMLPCIIHHYAYHQVDLVKYYAQLNAARIAA
jgi:hypothetical protein